MEMMFRRDKGRRGRRGVVERKGGVGLSRGKAGGGGGVRRGEGSETGIAGSKALLP